MKSGGFKFDDRLASVDCPENFGKSVFGFDSEVVGQTRHTQIAVDDQRFDAVGLRQHPRKIESSYAFTFASPNTGNDDGLEFLLFTL